MRLPRPQQGVHGRLQLQASHEGLTASLHREGHAGDLMLPDLRWAEVRRITDHGILITGHEIVPRRTNNKANADFFRQSWWCLVHTMFLGQVLDVAEPGEVPGGLN